MSYTVFNNILFFVCTVSLETVTLCSHLLSVMSVSKKSDNPEDTINYCMIQFANKESQCSLVTPFHCIIIFF